ncbi:MAG: DUF3866 family protein [Actinomycetota bacterium]
MIEISHGTVSSVHERHSGIAECAVDGFDEPAVALLELTGPVRVGDRVVLNTTAVSLGLGTGGKHFVIAVERGPDTETPTHVDGMKMRYSPLQTSVALIEESEDLPSSMEGTPVIAAGLHSAVVPAIIGIEATRRSTKIGYVHTDGAALPVALSETVAALRDRDRLHVCVSSGQSFGGDVEAVNIWSGMLAAKARGAEIVVVAMGPGNLGTGSMYGFALLEQASVLNAAVSVGASAIAIARIGFSDSRERHNGVSHHTLTALGAPTLVRATIPIPEFSDELKRARVLSDLDALAYKHEIVEVSVKHCEEALAQDPLLWTMGRNYSQEPDYFRTAAAAGAFAARSLERSH